MAEAGRDGEGGREEGVECLTLGTLLDMVCVWEGEGEREGGRRG